MKFSYDLLVAIGSKYGESFYLLSSNQFKKNYEELLAAFKGIYPNFRIAYSYKTNYTPRLCRLVNELGGLAEVVSDMEYELALKVGVNPHDIMFNGPYKSRNAVEDLLVTGGTVNIDSNYELRLICDIAKRNPESLLNVGIRCNFDIADGVVSRFGFDVHGEEFLEALSVLRQVPNIDIAGVHCHFASRSLDTWHSRVQGMLEVVAGHFEEPPSFVSLGGGLFGKMGESLKDQFDVTIPDYEDYASVVASRFKEFFGRLGPSRQPKLIIEPGSALVGDCMKFVTKVKNIKEVRGKKIATVAGSIYNINPTLNTKNLPIAIYHAGDKDKRTKHSDLDFGGYTCIESDYLYRGFAGDLEVNDYVVFDNVGSYSIVLKPPFILPNFAVIDYDDESGTLELVKERESFDDIFETYLF